MKNLARSSADLICGAILALAFLYPSLWYLILVGPALFWWNLQGRSPCWQRIGALLFGTAFYAVGLFWVTHVLKIFSGLPGWFALLSLLLLSLYLALYFLLAVTLAGWIAGDHFLTVLPLTFYLSELLRGPVVGGFPWNQWAQPLVHVPMFAQGAAFIGLTGLSAAVLALTTLPFLKGYRRFVTLGVVLIIILAGLVRYHRWEPGTDELKIAVIQPNIDEEARYHGASVDAWSVSRDLAAPFVIGGVDTVLFPESVVLTPFYTREDVVKMCQTWRDRGVDVFMNGNLLDGEDNWFNGAILFSGDHPDSHYRKMHLVPFGEYLPFRGLFEKLGFTRVARALEDFTPGEEIGVMKGRTSYGVSICYEVVFTSIVREQIKRDARVLISMTNDSWYGRMGADRQHLMQALFRAVEYDRPLARAALTGISSIATGQGRIISRIDQGERGAVMETIRGSARKTVYYYAGPFLPWIVLAMVACILLNRRIRNDREPGTS